MSDTIVPDDKDWTWVLETACPECGFEAGSIDVTDVGAMIRQNARDFVAVLTGEREAVRARPDPHTWSALEYGAHVRDVYRLFHERLAMMLTQVDPLFSNWNQDDTALEDEYGAQDPGTVAAELSAAAEVIAASFDQVTGDQWNRPGRRSDGSAFTVDTFAKYLIHDPIHHLHDVRP